MAAQKRVAITGIGMITPLGNSTSETWKALLEKKSGIQTIQSFDASSFRCKMAAEVKNFHLNSHVSKHKVLRYAPKITQFAIAAAEAALEDAKNRPSKDNQDRWGLVVGSGMMLDDFSNLVNLHDKFGKDSDLNIEKLGREGLSHFSPIDFGKKIINNGISLLAQLFNIHGYATSVHTACASGGQALGLGLQAIRRGEADYILAGGFDSMINPIGLSSFCLLGALSTYNDTPETASRPFDLSRNGFILGEGAAFLVLEDWEKAEKRGAHIYAELAGEGNTLSSYRITDSPPNGDGARQAIAQALADAKISIADVDYINAHGTSTKMNDLSETNAIKAVFGSRAKEIPISSTKGQLGHLIAAAGAVEAAICTLAIHTGVLPMTANLKQPDPECDLDYIADGPRKQEVRAALSNCFGFGGSNSCLAFLHPGFR